MPLDAGADFAGYTILRLLGAGGMGEVYLARHPRLPRQDALKVPPPKFTSDAEYRQRFAREADLIAGLWHPHIVGVHDRGEYDGKLWIAMDYVDGIDAGRLLADVPAGLPTRLVVEIVEAVAEALDYAHARHLQHRDVKPSNILISHPDSDEQRILLADFGIARRDDDTDLTATNMTVGTVAYSAPEQLMGAALDGRADQYALAATAFHLLTGQPPFQHSNPAVVVSQHLAAPAPSIGQRLPELAHLDGVLSKALSKDRSDRYARCVDFARALAHAGGRVDSGAGPADMTRLAFNPVAASAATTGPTAGKRGPLRPAILVPVALAVLLVAAVAFAIGQFAGDREGRSQHPVSNRPVPSPTSTPAVPAAPAPSAPASTTEPTVAVVESQPPPEATPASPLVAAVIGARCASPGAVSSTADGASAYCARLQYTDRYLWSLSPAEIANPVVTTSPVDPPPYEEESPVRICMQQTGHGRLRCAEEILRGNRR
jgi:serine/threonine protein kinase, bacterial